MLVGFYSIIFAFRRLVRPGVSIEMRKLFFKKHALYVILLIFIWIIMITYNYYEIFNPHYIFSKSLNDSAKVTQETTFEREKLNNDSIETLSQVAMFSTGELMVFIRLLDPFYKFLIQQIFLSWFGVVKDEPKEGIKTEVLSTFLASSLNIELVYIILAGITKFSNNKKVNKKDVETLIRDTQEQNFSDIEMIQRQSENERTSQKIS